MIEDLHTYIIHTYTATYIYLYIHTLYIHILRNKYFVIEKLNGNRKGIVLN